MKNKNYNAGRTVPTSNRKVVERDKIQRWRKSPNIQQKNRTKTKNTTLAEQSQHPTEKS